MQETACHERPGERTTADDRTSEVFCDSHVSLTTTLWCTADTAMTLCCWHWRVGYVAGSHAGCRDVRTRRPHVTLHRCLQFDNSGVLVSYTCRCLLLCNYFGQIVLTLATGVIPQFLLFNLV